MSTQPTTWCSANPPSTQERIRALYDHKDLIQQISEYPQAQIYNTFVGRWAHAIIYMESEVYETGRAVDRFIQDNLNIEESKSTRRVHKKLEREHINSLLLHARVVKNFKTMSSAPVPSKFSMEKFRRYSRSDKYGLRAANGEMADMYGEAKGSIPPDLATANDDDDLQPGAQFIRDWLMDPVLDYLVNPSKRVCSRRVWPILPIHGCKPQHMDQDVDIVHHATLNNITNMLVYVLATLILIAPIATFNSVEQQAPRIAIMPFFCLLLAASAQLMGPGTAHLFTIVIGYFQTMVVFVSNR